MDTYLLLKSLHVLGVVIFLGNIIVTALWKAIADRTGSPAIVAYAQRLVTITDFVFTALGAALIAITGPMMAERFGGVGAASWLLWGIGLFIASGIIWVIVLIPVQIMQARMARRFATQAEIPLQYRRLSTVWNAAGAVATLLPLFNRYFMVFKPT
jgi:uncharacterized membrane protein